MFGSMYSFEGIGMKTAIKTIPHNRPNTKNNPLSLSIIMFTGRIPRTLVVGGMPPPVLSVILQQLF